VQGSVLDRLYWTYRCISYTSERHRSAWCCRQWSTTAADCLGNQLHR